MNPATTVLAVVVALAFLVGISRSGTGAQLAQYGLIIGIIGIVLANSTDVQRVLTSFADTLNKDASGAADAPASPGFTTPTLLP